ncbi:flavin reductase [Lysinibacillus yapensis]|uniref:Flavin reductase n=1 Tax=Ureibacillus yapensis TaxID=2304605 RepID=A0A396SGS3_9BACL|nr:flavin reductase family protein [Lysinibacillus yapensis]RHW39478.1 flavin reductase [Lysinibacillus yapensis]
MEDRLFRNAMGKFATGVTVITTTLDDETYGMTANAFMSVSLNPPLVVVSIGEKASMLSRIEQSNTFAVSILEENQKALSQHFAGQRQEGQEIPFGELEGYPVIDGSVAQVVCDVVSTHVEGDHSLFIGKVKAIHIEDYNPLLFFNGGYKKLAVDELV